MQKLNDPTTCFLVENVSLESKAPNILKPEALFTGLQNGKDGWIRVGYSIKDWPLRETSISTSPLTFFAVAEMIRVSVLKLG